MEATITSIFNTKGGVGKSTSTHTMGHLLILAGYKVLIVDADAIASCTKTHGITQDEMKELDFTSLYCRDLKSKEEVQKYIFQSKRVPGADIIPASTVQMREMNLIIHEEKKQNPGTEFSLYKNLSYLMEDYDYIFIDSHANLDNISREILLATDIVYSPCTIDMDAYVGVLDVLNEISDIRMTYGKAPEFGGMFVVKAKKNQKVFRFFGEQSANDARMRYIDTSIRDTKLPNEANTASVPLYMLGKEDGVIFDYITLLLRTGLMSVEAYQKNLLPLYQK